MRERWASLVNESLREANIDARVDHRSLAAAHKKDAEGEVAFLKRALGADPFQTDAATRLERAYLGEGR